MAFKNVAHTHTNTITQTFIREDQRTYFGLKPFFLNIDLAADLRWLQKFEKENWRERKITVYISSKNSSKNALGKKEIWLSKTELLGTQKATY